jgi:hypothetical protein
MRTKCYSENVTGTDHVEDRVIYGRKVGRWESVDWMHLAQDRFRWRDLVNTVKKLQVFTR